MRNGSRRNWIGRAVVYSLASSLAGLAAGALLGAAGSLLPRDLRVALGSLLALVAIAIGGLELGGRPVRLPQRDHETPQGWVHAGPWGWAVRNGLALGWGATSRIGFWLWYAIPVGAALSGRPVLGAALYGTYGAVRGLALWGLVLGLPRWVGGDSAVWLLNRVGIARAIAAGQLLLLGAAAAIALGL